MIRDRDTKHWPVTDTVRRVVAAELETLAEECAGWADEAHGYPPWLRDTATEWREGKR